MSLHSYRAFKLSTVQHLQNKGYSFFYPELTLNLKHYDRSAGYSLLSKSPRSFLIVLRFCDETETVSMIVMHSHKSAMYNFCTTVASTLFIKFYTIEELDFLLSRFF